MKDTAVNLQQKSRFSKNKRSVWKEIYIHRSLFFMLLPGILLIFLFSYGPMYGLQIAFKDYNIGDGIWGSPWVGLKHFKKFFTDPASLNVIKNTIIISIYRLVWGFPAPIILALFFNEIGGKVFKRVSQTISYLPHFLSWVVISGIVINLLSPNTGLINYIIKLLGGDPIYFITSEQWFRTILVVSSIWKEVGWGTVVYLAALASVDPEIYEAAIVDGATRLQRIVYITLPSILSVASIMLILSMGNILNAGFDQVFNLYNPMVMNVADIIDTYVYRLGLLGFQYSFSAAVGLFKSIVGLIMILLVNGITKRVGSSENGLW